MASLAGARTVKLPCDSAARSDTAAPETASVPPTVPSTETWPRPAADDTETSKVSTADERAESVVGFVGAGTTANWEDTSEVVWNESRAEVRTTDESPALVRG